MNLLLNKFLTFWSRVFNKIFIFIPLTVCHLPHSLLLPLRYRIIVKGADLLQKHQWNKRTGILFLSNHTSNLDGTLIVNELFPLGYFLNVWAKDFNFRTPYIKWITKQTDTVRLLVVPNVPEKRSSGHQSKIQKLMRRTIEGLRQKQNFLMFPSGILKLSPHERIRGKSGVHQILLVEPNVNIVLVRMTGLWGSRFSYATKSECRWMPEDMPWSQIAFNAFKIIFFNFLLFIPKREITIEFVPAPNDFPRHGTRNEINRYLESFFNAAWDHKGEPLHRVPNYFWKAQYGENEYVVKTYKFQLDNIPKKIKNYVIGTLARKANFPHDKITMDMSLDSDLGLDSLEITEYLIQLEERFKLRKIKQGDVTSVGHLIAIAAKQPIVCETKAGNFHEVKEKRPAFHKIWQACAIIFEFFHITR